METLPNLLIVDDSHDNLVLYSYLLKSIKANLIEALSGQEALEKTHGVELALALIDVRMPIMNGYELALKLNGDAGGMNVPIIFITASHVNEIQIFKGYGSGAVDYIFKPLNALVLISKINVFLDLYNQKKLIANDAALLKKSADDLIRVNAELKNNEYELEMQNEELSNAIIKAEVATEKYTELYDLAPSGFITLSANNTILELNHSGARMLGKDRTSLIGSTFGLYISNETRPYFNNFFKNVFTTRGKGICEIEIETPDSRGIFAHVEGMVVADGNQCLINVIDISDRKKAEQLVQESESSLAEAQEIAHLGSWEWDLKTNMVKWSKAMYRVYDIDPGEFDGKPESLLKVIHPQDVDIFRESLDNNLDDGSSPVLEYRVIHKDGSVHHIFATGRMQFNKAGKPVKSFGTAQDITERKMAEQAITVSEEKYKTMLNASPDGILLLDLNGKITEVSEIGLEIFGADSRDDIVGKEFHQFVQAGESQNLRDIFVKTMNEGLAQNFELTVKKKNQSVFASEISTTLIQGHGGTPLSYMIIIRDISRRKKLETKQIHADRMANLGEMASGIAHEINQPLNTISLVMDNILYETAKEEPIAKEYLKKKTDRIFENITRIRNIIDHVRAFSRNQDDYILTGFDVNLTIRDAASMISEQFNHLAINLNLDLQDNLPSLTGNTYKFEQVILNLLSNAKDALLEKKSFLSEPYEMFIVVKSYQKNQQVVVEMIDNGIGISDDDIDNIMLPFYTTKDAGKGTGLGLSISYQIIKEMNGTIEIEKNSLNETIFRILL
jgi:PAS domain S-box-containing protein